MVPRSWLPTFSDFSAYWGTSKCPCAQIIPTAATQRPCRASVLATRTPNGGPARTSLDAFLQHRDSRGGKCGLQAHEPARGGAALRCKQTSVRQLRIPRAGLSSTPLECCSLAARVVLHHRIRKRCCRPSALHAAFVSRAAACLPATRPSGTQAPRWTLPSCAATSVHAATAQSGARSNLCTCARLRSR